MTEQNPKHEYDGPSKSQLKRDMKHLQDLGEDLTRLNLDQLRQLDLSEKLYDAIIMAQRLTKHEALRRQCQYIGKLMREIDVEPIVKLLTQIKLRDQRSTADFHQLERWREKLMTGDKTALTAYVEAHPHVDVQHLRHAIKAAVDERARGDKIIAYRALFQFLKTMQNPIDE